MLPNFVVVSYTYAIADLIHEDGLANRDRDLQQVRQLAPAAYSVKEPPGRLSLEAALLRAVLLRAALCISSYWTLSASGGDRPPCSCLGNRHDALNLNHWTPL
jgi:hypothetical protein